VKPSGGRRGAPAHVLPRIDGRYLMIVIASVRSVVTAVPG
jgi:hypothetical protein